MKISVCMATYNGERYLSEQLESILSQLRLEDELIVVDDASQDSTYDILVGFRDPRMLIMRNKMNQGVLASFEIALRHAKGEVIFLSDQDDVWHPEKVSRFLSLFRMRPDITLAISDAKIIDGDGRTISSSRLAGNKFKTGVLANLLKNNYLGCALAFRRDILRYCLPFPSSIPMHDMWIGILNELYGKTVFIEDQLINHRRHGRNASRDKHGSYSEMFRWRMNLIINLLHRRLTVSRDVKAGS